MADEVLPDGWKALSECYDRHEAAIKRLWASVRALEWRLAESMKPKTADERTSVRRRFMYDSVTFDEPLRLHEWPALHFGSLYDTRIAQGWTILPPEEPRP